jgi:transcriptional regulator with XRE-family HTH domain
MLDELARQGLSMAYLERALSLSPRTIARWKNGELSASALALLRLVRCFPWLLKVARADFDNDKAHAELCSEALRVMRAGEAANTGHGVDFDNIQGLKSLIRNPGDHSKLVA